MTEALGLSKKTKENQKARNDRIDLDSFLREGR
jgi:hypothetical protein